MGLATVPSVTRLQKLKDGGLVVSSEDTSPVNPLVFHKSWTVDEIDAWPASLFPRVWGYYETNLLLPEDDKYWIPAVARQGKLDEFEKKEAITGKDLVTCRSGKGKRAGLTTLYFG
jgi:hypothetical protein